MKIRIETIREIPEEMFWDWIKVANGGAVPGPTGGASLLRKGRFEHTSIERNSLGETRATTTYEVLER